MLTRERLRKLVITFLVLFLILNTNLPIEELGKGNVVEAVSLTSPTEPDYGSSHPLTIRPTLASSSTWYYDGVVNVRHRDGGPLVKVYQSLGTIVAQRG